MLQKRRLTIKYLTDVIGTSEGSVRTILKDNLGLRQVKSRLVPKALHFLEKSRRVDVCETMHSNKLICIIMGDETWIYAYDPETTDQSSEYRAKGVARPKRARQSSSKIKFMMTVFFDFRAIWHVSRIEEYVAR